MQSLFDSMNICVSPVGNVSLNFMATRGLVVSRTYTTFTLAHLITSGQ